MKRLAPQNQILLLLLVALSCLTACNAVKNQPSPPQPSPIANETASTPPVAELINVSPAGVSAAEPAVAAGSGGGVFVAWVEHKDKNADLMIRRYDASGRAENESVRVNPQPGQVKTWFGDPPTIKVGQDGTVYVGWTAKVESSKSTANVLYLSVSRDNGNSFAAPVKINDDAGFAAHGMHSLAIDQAGRIYAAWLDERNLKTVAEKASAETETEAGENFHYEKALFFHHKAEPEPNSELYFAVSGDGGKTFSPNKKLASEVCPCCKTSLLAASDNRVYVSWRQVLRGDFRHIAVASTIDAGKNFSAPVIVSDDRWQISACPVSGAALAEVDGKNLLVSWFTAGEAGSQGIYRAGSADGGKTFSPRALVSENAVSGTPSLIAARTRPATIVWAEDDKILTAGLAAESKAERREIGEGKLPAAAVSGERLFVVFVARNGDASGVKLFVSK